MRALLALLLTSPAAAQNRGSAAPLAPLAAASAGGVSVAPAPLPTLGSGGMIAPPALPSVTASAVAAGALALPAMPAAAAPLAIAPASYVTAPGGGLRLSDPAAPASPAPDAGGAAPAKGALEAARIPIAGSLSEPGRTQDAALKSDAESDWARRMGEPGRKLNVLAVGTESVPYFKTGGLGDVVDAVSRGLVQRGHRVTLMLPKFRSIDAAKHGFKPVPMELSVPVGDRHEPALLWKAEREGVDVYLIQNDSLHSPEGAYAPRDKSMSDDDERFIHFSRAALEAARALGFKPDIVHTHDWHPAIIPALLKRVYLGDPFFAAARTVHTIHNMAYQGMFHASTLLKAGFSALDFTPDKLEYWGGFNFMKAGLVFADALTTVSPTYGKEIRENPEFGRGLEGVLRFRAADLTGILNGIDPKLWNPLIDAALSFKYDADDVTAGKAAGKAELQRAAGLELDPGAPIFAAASRLDHQKGLDVAADAVEGLLARGAQVIVAGAGDAELKARFEALARKHPGRFYFHGFDEVFVRKLYAGADFMLMPSRFEPCGLTQLISQRYGTLPIVARTGGLADTVRDISDDPKGDGFFLREFSAAGILEAADRALGLYRRPDRLEAHRRIAMAKDSSWERAIEQYERLFFRLLGSRSQS